MSTIALRIEFGGGLELLFSNQRSHRVSIPAGVLSGADPARPADVAYLIGWLRDNLLKERAELFVENGTV